MQNEIIKLYENVTDEPILVRELSLEVPAHDRVSVKSAYPTPFNPVNYPGLVEVGGLTAEEHDAAVRQARDSYTATTGKSIAGAVPQQSAPTVAQPSPAGTLDIEKNPGGQPNA